MENNKETETVAEQKEESFTHSTSSFKSLETELFYQSWKSKDPNPLCTIIIEHGLGDHSGHYMTIIRKFTKCNFYGFDKRGHGNTVGKKGHLDTWEHFRNDLKTFIVLVREKEPNLPIFLFGNSMGGLVVIDYFHQPPAPTITGAFVNRPALNFTDIGSFSAFAIRCMRSIAPGFQINLGLDSTKLTSDPEYQKENDTDKLIHSLATPSLLTELNKVAVYSRHHPELLTTPTLMIQGDKDPIITPSSNKKFMDQVIAKNSSSKLYMAPDCKHESFTELPERREAIFTVMQEFIDQTLQNTNLSTDIPTNDIVDD